MLYFLLSVIILELALFLYFFYISIFEPYLSSRRYKIWEEVSREKKFESVVSSK